MTPDEARARFRAVLGDAVALFDRQGEAADDRPELPRTIGGFEVKEELGSGSFGVVYHVRDLLLGVDRAVKVPHPGIRLTADQRRRFIDEARRVASIDGDNVVRVFSVDEFEGRPLIVMELCSGGSLADWLKKRDDPDRPLPARWAARIAEEVARGVHQAHLARILHRDLKPENILLVRDGTEPENGLPRFRVKVADFGLAKAVEGDDGSMVWSASTGRVGTLLYSSPEQLRNEPIRETSDIFSIGVILHQLLTGSLPFGAVSEHQLVDRIMRGEMTASPRSTRPGDVSIDLETICLACLRRDPKGRYATADALRRDLELYRLGRPIRMRRYTRTRRLLDWARFQPTLAALFGLSLLFVIGLIVGLVVLVTQNRDLVEATLLANAMERESRAVAEVGTIRHAGYSLGSDQPIRTQEILDDVESEAIRGSFPFRYLARESRRKGEVLHRFDGSAKCSCSTPDGNLIVHGTVRGQVVLVRGRAVETIAVPPLEGKASPSVHRIAVAPDGRLLALVLDAGVFLLDLGTRRFVGVGHKGFPDQSPLFLDGGRLLAIRILGTETIGLIDVGNSDQPRTKRLFDDTMSYFGSPDGRYLILETSRGPAMSIVDVTRVSERIAFEDCNGVFFACVFSPDSTMVAVSRDGQRNIRVYDIIEGKPRLRREITKNLRDTGIGSELGLAFSPDSKSIAITGHVHDITIYCLGSNGEIHLPLPHVLTEPFKVFSFSADGRELHARQYFDDAWLRWETSTGRPLPSLPALPGETLVGPFYPSPLRKGAVVFATRTLLRLWQTDPEPSRARTLDPGALNYVWSISPSPDGATFASGGGRPMVRLWDRKTLALIRNFEGHTEAVGAVAFSPDGRTLASGSHEASNNLKLWDVATGRLLFDLVGHTDKVRSVAFSPDGKTLASGAWDRTVRLWDVATGRCLSVLEGHEGKVGRLTYSPDGKTLAILAYFVYLRDVATSAIRVCLPRGDDADEVTSIAFSPDSQTLATADYAGRIHLRDAATGRLLRSVRGEPGECRALAYTPDGRILASSTEAGPIQLWDVASGHVALTLEGHKEFSNSLGFTNDGLTLISGGHDGIIRVWDAGD